jgi:hypothetical protein
MKKSLSELATGWEPGKPTLSYDTVRLLLSLEVLSRLGTRYECRSFNQNIEGIFRILLVVIKTQKNLIIELWLFV